MRKVIKIFLSVLSVIILTAIIVPVTAWLLLYLPPVQHYVVREASQWASQTFGIDVRFDKVRIKLFNAAAFEGFYVGDYDRDTLMYFGHISTGVDMRALMRREIILRDVRLEDSKIHIKQYEDGSTNLGQVVEKFRSEEPVPIKLIAASVDCNNLEVRYKSHSARQTEYGFNPGDMELREMNLSARDFSIIGDSIAVRLDRLNFVEKSGFLLSGFSSPMISVGPDGIEMADANILTPDTDLTLTQMRIRYNGEDRSLSQAQISAEIGNSSFGFPTLAYFVPSQRDNTTTLTDLNATFSGTVADFAGMISTRTGGNTRLFMLYAMRGLPDVSNTTFSVVLDSLVTSSGDIRLLAENFTGRHLSDSLNRRIDGLQNITLKASFNGRPNDFAADAQFHTAQGSGHADLSYSPAAEHPGRSAFSGTLDIRDFELGEALGLENLGRLSISGDLHGTSEPDNFVADANLQLAHLEFNGYDYHDVSMNGRVWNRQFLGRIHSPDRNVRFDFDGLLDFNAEVPRYDFALRMDNADLRKLNVNKRDSVSIIRFDARVAGSGNGPDDMNGEIVINNMLYVNHVDSIRTGTISLTGRNNEASKQLTFTSDFADAAFRSRMSYQRLAEYLTQAFYTYLPSLSETNRPCILPLPEGESDLENYSVLNIEVKQANNVAGIFVPGLILAEGSKLSMTFNPDTERFTLAANSDYLEKGNNFASGLELNSRNQGDSLSLFLRAKEFYSSGILVPDFSLIAGARDNFIGATARFEDTQQERSGLVGVEISLNTHPDTGQPFADIRFTPSYYEQGGQKWNIFGRNITASRDRISVGSFGVDGSGQLLRMSGQASANPSDTLRIQVQNFDINPLSGLLNVGYQFYGKASGQANISSLMSNPVLTAAIDIDSVFVDSVAAPPLQFLSSWQTQEQQALFFLGRRDNEDPIVLASFNPRTKEIDGTLSVKNMDLSLLDVHYEGTLGRTTGTADLTGTIGGRGRQIKVNGELDLHDYQARVDFLNVYYTAAPGTILNLEDNVLKGENIVLFDPYQNTAAMDLRIDLNKLNNVNYTFNIRPENVLALNTTAADNELFYGQVFASGNLQIKGSKQGVNLDITATTSDNSRFYMPLSDKNDMSDVDFVTFVQPENRQPADTTQYNMRKRMIMNRTERNRRIESSGNINTNIALTVLPNTLVELLIDPQTGHTVRGRGNGSLNLHVNPKNDEFTMYGDYLIDEGVYLFTLENIIEKPFAIEQGSNIQWTGDPVDAMLNISGVYRLKTSISPAVSAAVGGDASDVDGYSNWRTRMPIECRIMLTDRLSMPSLSFNITAPGASPEAQQFLSQFLNTQEMMATQFFFLLATGNFYDYEGSGGNIGAAAGTATAFDFLSNQFSNWISSDRFNIGIRYRPQTETTSDEWGVDFSQQLLGNRLLLEMEGNYDTQNNAQAVYTDNMKNFTGDFYLTGLLDRTGNLKAKIFTRTITRFDENQGLQESGVGLYYTEDFNTFGDVLRNLKDRFTGERRRRRQLMKEMERRAGQEAEETDEGIERSADAVPGEVGVENTGADEEATPAEDLNDRSGWTVQMPENEMD